MTGPVVLTLTIPNPEDIHPELMRDDVGDALAERGFDGFSIDVAPGTRSWTIRQTIDGGYAIIQPDGAASGIVYLGVEAFAKAEADAAARNLARAEYLRS